MQMLPFPVNVPPTRKRSCDDHRYEEAPSSLGRLIMAFVVIAGVLAGLEIAAGNSTINAESRVASFERQEIQP